MISIDELIISLKDLKEILSRSLSSQIEQTGLLIGKFKERKAFVKRVVFTKNINKSSISFTIDPMEVYRTIINAEKEGLEVVGIYHSHPAPPAPSLSDKRGMKLWPVVWLIVNSITGDYAAWNPDSRRVRIKIEDRDIN